MGVGQTRDHAVRITWQSHAVGPGSQSGHGIRAVVEFLYCLASAAAVARLLAPPIVTALKFWGNGKHYAAAVQPRDWRQALALPRLVKREAYVAGLDPRSPTCSSLSAGASSSAVCTACHPGSYSAAPGARGVGGGVVLGTRVQVGIRAGQWCGWETTEIPE